MPIIRPTAAPWTLLLAVTSTVLLIRCGADTGGALVEINIGIQPDWAEAPGNFETNNGWLVELTSAELFIEQCLFFAPLDSVAIKGRHFKLMSVARAHGGYDPFSGRRVRAELVGPFTIDLLEPQRQHEQTIEAEAGRVDSAAVVYGENGDGVQSTLVGTATKGDEVVDFEGRLTLEMSALQRRVDEIPSNIAFTNGGALTLHIDLPSMLDEADFSRLETEGHRAGLLDDFTQPHTAWAFGARTNQTYRVTWTKR